MSWLIYIFTGEVNWVQCDRCEEWFHLLCVGLAEDEVSEEEDYECFLCKQRKQPSILGDYKTVHASPQKSGVGFGSNIMDSLNYGNVSVIKTEPDDSQQEVDVTMDTGIVGYEDVLDSFNRSQLGKSKMSTKVTQFSYDDESSQEELKNSYELAEEDGLSSGAGLSNGEESENVPRNIGMQFGDIREEVVGNEIPT